MSLPDNAPAKNAGTEDWQAYAGSLGIEGADEMSRNEAIDAVETVFATPDEATDWDEDGPVLEKKSAPYFDL